MEQEGLHDYLDKKNQGVFSASKAKFIVNDKEQANWALRKIKQLEAMQKENEELATSEKEKIEEWQSTMDADLGKQIQFFRNHLYQYASQLRRKDSSFQTLKLPYGTIGFRGQAKKWHYGDEKKLISLLKNMGQDQLIRVKEELKKIEVKKYFKVKGENAYDPNTGQVLDGVRIEHKKASFYATPTTD